VSGWEQSSTKQDFSCAVGKPGVTIGDQGGMHVLYSYKMNTYENCNICPRGCKVNRENSGKGFCNESSHLRIARASLHMWEEPCISGSEGSGTVFFCGCNLRCVFCQNASISTGEVGKEISVSKLADIFLSLQQKKANNINLVTPTHFIPSIKDALIQAKANGLTIPIVYNTGGYESVESLRKLKGLVDIFLPDFKYVSNSLSLELSGASDYFEIASKALEEMVSQVGECEFDQRDMIKSGVIVRHLILPGHTKDSKAVIKYLYETYGDKIYISIMNQYTPMPHILSDNRFPTLQRKVTKKEYDSVVDYAISLGVTNGFIQEGETAKESFIPPFDLSGF